MMNGKTTKIIVAVAVVLGLAGGGTALAVNHNNTQERDAMMQSQAMKKADEAKAMKQAADTAAMKKDEAAKSMSSDDAMMSGDAMSKTDQ